MIRICLYIKENPDNPSQTQLLEVNRVPAMGEFIDLGLNLYRVFLVCHSPYNSEFQASVAALKTDWDDCLNLIDQKDNN